MTEPSQEAQDAMAEAASARVRIAEKAPRWRRLNALIAEGNAANHYADMLAAALASTVQTTRRPAE